MAPSRSTSALVRLEAALGTLEAARQNAPASTPLSAARADLPRPSSRFMQTTAPGFAVDLEKREACASLRPATGATSARRRGAPVPARAPPAVRPLLDGKPAAAPHL